MILEFDDGFSRDFSSGISGTAIFIRIQIVRFGYTFFNSNSRKIQLHHKWHKSTM